MAGENYNNPKFRKNSFLNRSKISGDGRVSGRTLPNRDVQGSKHIQKRYFKNKIALRGV